MKRLLLATTILAAVGASSAKASDTAIILWNTANPGGAESALGTGSASVLSSNLNGITISVSSVLKGTTPNQLTEANLNIDNTDLTTQTLKIIVGANEFAGPSGAFKLTGTIGVTKGTADLQGSYFVDGTDSLNGQSLSVTGTDITNFDSLSLLGPDSFSFNGSGFDKVLGPYGLAEELTLTLAPGAAIFVQGVSMTSVPEPRTWILSLLGFGALGLAGLGKRRLAAY